MYDDDLLKILNKSFLYLRLIATGIYEDKDCSQR